MVAWELESSGAKGWELESSGAKGFLELHIGWGHKKYSAVWVWGLFPWNLVLIYARTSLTLDDPKYFKAIRSQNPEVGRKLGRGGLGA